MAQFTKDTLSTLNDLKSDKVLREACLNSIALVSHRIQQEGKKTDGSKIQTSASEKTGAYSLEYGKKREKSGRQVDIIDMTFSDAGGMMDSFTFEAVNNNEYHVGFAGKYASDKAEWNEARFGELFTLSDEEQNAVDEIILNVISEIMK